MKDEHGNEAPYDFKNIMFKRYLVEDTTDSGMHYGIDNTYCGINSNLEGISIDETDYM